MEVSEQSGAQVPTVHKTPLSPVSASMDIPRKRTGQIGSLNPPQQSTSQFSSPGVLYGSSLPAGMCSVLCWFPRCTYSRFSTTRSFPGSWGLAADFGSSCECVSSCDGVFVDVGGEFGGDVVPVDSVIAFPGVAPP